MGKKNSCKTLCLTNPQTRPQRAQGVPAMLPQLPWGQRGCGVPTVEPLWAQGSPVANPSQGLEFGRQSQMHIIHIIQEQPLQLLTTARPQICTLLLSVEQGDGSEDTPRAFEEHPARAGGAPWLHCERCSTSGIKRQREKKQKAPLEPLRLMKECIKRKRKKKKEKERGRKIRLADCEWIL